MRPPQIYISCATGNLALEGIRWTSWGPKTAEGSGTFVKNSCTPSCADGQFLRFRARFRLSDPGETPVGYIFQSVTGDYVDHGTKVPFQDHLS